MVKIWRLKGLSLKTIDNYKGHLRRYLNYFKKEPIEIKLSDQQDYFLKLNVHHRNQAIAVIRQLHFHLMNKPIDWRDLPYCKKPKHLPEYFTGEEVKLLLKNITNPKQKCCVAIQYLCGLRISEVVDLKQSDINTKLKIIRVTGKGNKQREVPLPDDTIKYLKLYWKWVSPKPKIYLFGGQYGGKYSPRSIQQVINRAKEKAGINKECNSHGLRHSAATIRINKLGWNTRQTQEFLGHSSIKTTEIYTHVGIKDMQNLTQPSI